MTINIQKETEKKLTELYSIDVFKQEVQEYKSYYFQKFLPYIKDHEDDVLEQFNKMFHLFIDSQIFQGYYIATEILTNEETKIENEFFLNDDGYMIEGIISIFTQAVGENLFEIIRTEVTGEFTQWAIREFENIRPTIRQIMYDATIYGAKQRFIEEKKLRNIINTVSEVEGYFSSPTQIQYVLPDVYIENMVFTSTEVWEIYRSSTYPNESSIGEINIIEIPLAQAEYRMVVTLSNELSDFEKQIFVTRLVEIILKKGKITKESLTVSIVFASEFYQYQF